MTSDVQTNPDWVSLLPPKARPGVMAAYLKNPAAYDDALRRVTGGSPPMDRDTANTVATILIGSTMESGDLDIAQAAVTLGVHAPDAGYRQQERIVSLVPKDLAVEALAPKSIRQLNLATSTGDRFGTLVSNTLIEVLHTQVSKIFWDEFAKAFITDGWSQILWDSMVGKSFRNAANAKVRTALGLAAQTGFNEFSMLPPGVTVTGAARFITPWADNYANTQIENYDVQSAKAVQDSLNRYVTQGLTQQAMASRIRASYGLDTRSAFALDAYRDNMLAQRPKQAGLVGKLALSYADKLLRNRTDMVGQTTAMTAMNFGRLLVFTQAQSQGLIPPTIKKVWVTAIDERVCPTCRPMDGVTADMNDSFQVRYHSSAKTHKKASAVFKENAVVELLVPPAHPNCRCTIVLDSEFDQGIITRTAQKQGRLSLPEDKVLAKAWRPDLHPRDLTGKFKDGANQQWEKLSPHQRDIAIQSMLFVGVVGAVVGAQVVGYTIAERAAQRSAGTRPITYKPFKPFDLRNPVDDPNEHWVEGDLDSGPEGPRNIPSRVYKHLQGSSYEETMNNIRNAINDKKVEFGFLVDGRDGRIFSGARGDEKHVSMFAIIPDSLVSHLTTIHNHPGVTKEDLKFFGMKEKDLPPTLAFSLPDLQMWINSGMQRLEVVGPLGERRVVFSLNWRHGLPDAATKQKMMDSTERILEDAQRQYRRNKSAARNSPIFAKWLDEWKYHLDYNIYRLNDGFSKAWKPDLHPRDDQGRFADKFGDMLKQHGVGAHYETPRKRQAEMAAVAGGVMIIGGTIVAGPKFPVTAARAINRASGHRLYSNKNFFFDNRGNKVSKSMLLEYATVMRNAAEKNGERSLNFRDTWGTRMPGVDEEALLPAKERFDFEFMRFIGQPHNTGEAWDLFAREGVVGGQQESFATTFVFDHIKPMNKTIFRGLSPGFSFDWKTYEEMASKLKVGATVDFPIASASDDLDRAVGYMKGPDHKFSQESRLPPTWRNPNELVRPIMLELHGSRSIYWPDLQHYFIAGRFKVLNVSNGGWYTRVTLEQTDDKVIDLARQYTKRRIRKVWRRVTRQK